MAKLLKLRRGTTTQHASFTGAEGEVTVDTTKDTAVVHDGSQAGGRPMAREDMSNVSSASIAGQLGTDSIAVTKIAAGTLPSDVKITDSNISGSLTMATGDINDNAVTYAKMGNIGTNSIMGRISSGDGDPETLTAINVRTIINVENGATADQTPNEIRASVESATDSNVFTDADHSKLNGVAASANNYSISSDLLDEDNMASNSATKVASQQSIKAYVDAEVAGVVNSAPAALDTLNELAAALGDDANYAATTATSIGTKLPKSGGQMTGNITMSGSQTVDGRDLSVDGSKLDGIESGATAAQTKSDIDGLNINADQVDGLHASSFLRSDTNTTATSDITVSGGGGALTVAANSDIRFNNGSWTGETSAKIQQHSNILYIQYPDAGTFRVRDSAGNNNLTLDSSGNLTAVGNVTAYSDVRLKTDIHTINDALGICGKLRGVSYKWIKDGKESIGVIAQEVEEILPEVVLTNIDYDPSTGEETEVKSVDYGKIVGVLINAINELKAELDEHKKGGK